jgi:Family of unknown function (DUF5946)
MGKKMNPKNSPVQPQKPEAHDLKPMKCFSCGGEFEHIEGPVHRYMASSPGCWAAFGEVLAREYSDVTYYAVHRMSVDAYAAQHPGVPSKQTIGSVGVHLIRLCMVFEQGLTPEKANDTMLKASKVKSSFTCLEPPQVLGAITVQDVLGAANAKEHKTLVREWAKGAWQAWSSHHQQVRMWLSASGQY